MLSFAYPGSLTWQTFPETIAAVLYAMNDGVPGTFAEGIRIPGAFDGFETAVRAILGQQITVKAASTLAARFVAVLGTPIETGHPGLTHLFHTGKDPFLWRKPL